MLKYVRTKVASSVSDIKLPEQFAWEKWLRSPLNDLYIPEPFYRTKIYEGEEFFENLIAAENKEIKFILKKIPSQKKFIKLEFQRAKTYLFFFGFGSTLCLPYNPWFLITPVYDLKKYLLEPKTIKLKDLSRYFIDKETDVKEIKKNFSASNKKDIKDFRKYFLDSNSTSKIAYCIKNPASTQIDFSIQNEAAISINYAPSIPEISENLSGFVPKIYNMELLSSSELKNVSIYSTKVVLLEKCKVIKVKNTFRNFSQGKIYKVKNIKIPGSDYQARALPKISPVPFYKINFINDLPEIRLLDIKEYFPKVEELPVENFVKIEKPAAEELAASENSEPVYTHEEIALTEPEPEKSEIIVNQNDYDSVLFEEWPNRPYDHSIFKDEFVPVIYSNASEFLFRKKIGVLFDAFLENSRQNSISAMRELFEEEKIRSVLVISADTCLGFQIKNNGFSPGWIKDLTIAFPRKKVKQISDFKNESVPAAEINAMDYNYLISLLNNECTLDSIISHFDMVIWDEAESQINTGIFKNVVHKPDKYYWYLSALNGDNLLDKFNSLFRGIQPGLVSSSFMYNDVSSPSGSSEENIWLKMNDEQTQEYRSVLTNWKKHSTEIITSGNPYRFLAALFVLFHQLKQISNFSSKSEKSPKLDILVKQLERIKINGKKAVIISQYDKHGIQKIEKILIEKGIKYVKILQGKSGSEFDQKIHKYNTNKDITILLIASKAILGKIGLVNTSYIINFDCWWDPIADWRLQEKIIQDRPVKRLYYQIMDSIDEEIFGLLSFNGLLDKEVFEIISTEAYYELIQHDEWLNIIHSSSEGYLEQFNMELQEAELAINNCTSAEYIEKVEHLFSKLGYKNFQAMKRTDDLFCFSGVYNQDDKKSYALIFCYLNEDLNYNELNENLHLYDKSGVKKVFVLSRSNIPETNEHPHLIFFDSKKLANYLIRFRII